MEKCLPLCCLFSEPNDESAANVDAAKKWREDRRQFEEIAAATVKKSLGLWKDKKMGNLFCLIFKKTFVSFCEVLSV